jgi:outer membrane protein
MAEGDLAAARGELASQLGLSPTAPIKLVELDEPGADEMVFLGNVSSLIEQAKVSHPAIEKARADWAASQAKAVSTKAQGPLTVSLFSNLNRRRAQAASYESAAREQALQEVENSIALRVWKNRQTLESRTRALAISRLFVESATRSYEIAQGRYRTGVGNIIELLRSQNDLSAANQKRVESLVNWHNAKLQLASDLLISTLLQPKRP